MTTTRSQPAIRATGLRKSFGDKVVLDGIDLDVPAGTIFALLGPNGAGKTTTVHILSTLIGDPRIVFLDEPTTGLDPRSRRTMWQIIRDLVAGGATILLTTQYLEEADELADRIALLDRGRLVAEGTPDELKRLIPGGHIRLQFAYADGLESAARVLGEAVRDDEALTLQVPSDGSVKSLRALLDRLDGASVEVGALSVHLPDLDDVFLALTGQPDNEKEPPR